MVGGMRPALLATLAALGVILALACANVAAMMFGQVNARSTTSSPYGPRSVPTGRDSRSSS